MAETIDQRVEKAAAITLSRNENSSNPSEKHIKWKELRTSTNGKRRQRQEKKI